MAQTSQSRHMDQVQNEAQRVFKLQRDAYLRDPYPSLADRRRWLRALDRLLIEEQEAIADAINADFGHRSAEETKMAEIFVAVEGIRDTLRHLRRWMRPQHRRTSVIFATGQSYVVPQPKGVVGIVAPWNYPLLLAIGPLTCALAAGNRTMIKLATRSQHLCRLLADKVRAVVPEEVVAFLPGVPAQEFSTLPFDHLVFTGSADVGRTVMCAAAENLTPVTLELGGKSPTIIADDFDVAEAASRILFGKLLNAGQTCIAPDYLFVPASKRDDFVAAARSIVPKRYPDVDDRSYTSIIDDKAYRRLRATLEDAEAKGARPVPLLAGARFNDRLRKIPPHLVLDVSDEMRIMQEEIFGPLLPIKTYQHLDEVIAYLGQRDRPLALYLFSNDSAIVERMLYRTISGGVTVNHCMFHITQHDLPFGGTGASGTGQYHGYEGFLELSKLRPVFHAPKIPHLDLFMPPFNDATRKLLDLVLKWAP
ncbi:MAG: coniferyl aldehyde dehydrogenase [Deltaproteobacteria bacterium]|nr:coniferyl aldehyde dehydrogenase [Deltaproteobacteria bacterium]